MIWGVIRGSPKAPPLPFAALWCAALAWQWYVLLGIPYEIRLHSPDSISFVALRRTSTLAAFDIYSIKPYGGMGGGFYVLHHKGGKIRLLVQFTGFYEVLSRIKATNPAFETVGI